MTMSKQRKQFKCLLLVIAIIAMLCVLPESALASISYEDADAPEYYVYNTYGLNVYRKPSTKADVGEVVPYARNLKRVYVKNGWAKVYTVNRVLGYCKEEYLTRDNPNIYDITMYCQQKEAPYYRYPNVNSPLMGSLSRDEAVKVTAMTPLGDWLRFLADDNHYYYIQRPRMDTVKFKKGTKAWCNKESMQVYYNPEMSTKMGTLYFGQEVSLVDQRGSIAKIHSVSGIVAYCKYSDLTASNPNTLNQTVYTQVDGNYLFKSSTNLSGRVQIKKNTPMTLLAVDEKHYWARVNYNGENYYVPYVYLDMERRNDNFKKVTARVALHIRAGTKKDSSIVATVPAGTTLWLIGATDTRARVATSPDADGTFQTGYVELAYLK